ncbi:MAG: N-acetylmuramoyl-L-alanine amidase [Xanthomonadales bacterium]
MTRLVIHQAHLPYAGQLDPRKAAHVDLAVIHCTELPDLTTAREFGMRIHDPECGTGHCGHYYIDRDGRVEEWVPPERIAHHVRGFNQRSLGIELVNRGRYPHWLNSNTQVMTEPYAEEQITSLVELLNFLCAANRELRWIAGHEQLDSEKVPATDNPRLLVCRKRDPGPLFPWEAVLRAIPLKAYC